MQDDHSLSALGYAEDGPCLCICWIGTVEVVKDDGVVVLLVCILYKIVEILSDELNVLHTFKHCVKLLFLKSVFSGYNCDFHNNYLQCIRWSGQPQGCPYATTRIPLQGRISSVFAGVGNHKDCPYRDAFRLYSLVWATTRTAPTQPQGLPLRNHKGCPYRRVLLITGPLPQLC